MSEAHGNHRWRVGRKDGRTIYAQIGPTPADSDPPIGMMDTPELGAMAVFAHNVYWTIEEHPELARLRAIEQAAREFEAACEDDLDTAMDALFAALTAQDSED